MKKIKFGYVIRDNNGNAWRKPMKTKEFIEKSRSNGI